MSRQFDPAVTVVLPTYDREPLLWRSIRSVLDQTYEDFELIIVDDGSTDATAESVARFGDRRLRCIRLAENRGAAAARNVGIRAATGRFIAFQDSDDEWLPSKLERHMRAFETCGPEVAIVAHGGGETEAREGLAVAEGRRAHALSRLPGDPLIWPSGRREGDPGTAHRTTAALSPFVDRRVVSLARPRFELGSGS